MDHMVCAVVGVLAGLIAFVAGRVTGYNAVAPKRGPKGRFVKKD